MSKIKTLIEILMNMEVNSVYAKNTLIKMVDPDHLKVKDEELINYQKRSFDALMCRAKSRIMYARYKTNSDKQIKRIL